MTFAPAALNIDMLALMVDCFIVQAQSSVARFVFSNVKNLQ